MNPREIDALVAERVFGWSWFECVQTACLVPPMMASDWRQAGEWMYKPLPDGPGKLFRDDIDGIRFYDSSKGGHTHPHIKNYSTDITAAWTVVEKMAKRGYEIDMVGLGKAYRCSFWSGDQELGKRRSMYAPMAICLSALRAVGVPEKGVGR